MDEFKFKLSGFFLFLFLLGSSYWAFQQINPKFIYRSEDLVSENSQLGQEDIKGENENSPKSEDLGLGKGEIFETNASDGEEMAEGKKGEGEKAHTGEQLSLDSEHKFLLEKLQGLIDDKIYMKRGSRGTRVGTVQKFLNLYFDSEVKVDNDYGPKTFDRVKEFQKREGLDADGLAGPQTYRRMIELIKGGKV